MALRINAKLRDSSRPFSDLKGMWSGTQIYCYLVNGYVKKSDLALTSMVLLDVTDSV